MKLPPGLTFKGTLPVWPALTRAPDGKFSPPPKPSDCEPAEASFCLTTSSFATTVANGATKTTATQVKSTCATVTGCNLRDAEETKSQDACKLTRRDIDSATLIEATGVPEIRALQKRAEPNWSCERPGVDFIIILKDRTNEDQRSAVKSILEARDEALKDQDKPHGHHEVRSQRLGYTAFFFVDSLGPVLWESLEAIEADNVSKSPGERYVTPNFVSCADGGCASRFKACMQSLTRRPCKSEMTTETPPETTPSYPGTTLGPCGNEPLNTCRQINGTCP
jgi:chitinase